MAYALPVAFCTVWIVLCHSFCFVDLQRINASSSSSGFSKNGLLYSSLQSPTLSISHSVPVYTFHPILKESTISPLLKKSGLDKDQMSNYRPISNMSLISMIIERIVKVRLTDHLSSNNLLNPHQSAYCKHHSTETALLYIHDNLINSIGSQKLSCLCLIDLSAAFDKIGRASCRERV